MAELDPEDEAMPMSEILADIAWQTGGEFEYEPEWDGEDSGVYAAQLEAEEEFPEGFQGSGPMFAAVPLGRPWLEVATAGATTYILHDSLALAEARGDIAERPQSLHEGYAGFSAFLDRDQAEQIADHPDRSGEFYRWEGLTGVPDCTARREAEIAEDVDWDPQADGFFPEAS